MIKSALIFDVEANGLLDTADKIWCVAHKSLFLVKESHKHHNHFEVRVDSDYDEDLSAAGFDMIHFIRDIYQDAEVLIGHNIIAYDIPLLEQLYDIDFSKKKIIDTLILSKTLNPRREYHPACPRKVEYAKFDHETQTYTTHSKLIGPHSLEALGFFVGEKKIQISDWELFDEKIVERCKQDVLVTEKILYYLLEEGNLEKEWIYE